MQTIETYADSNDFLRLALQGPSGSGKTTLSCQFPGAYIIDMDVNLGGSLRYIREHKLKLPVGYDVLDRDDKGEPVDIFQRFGRLNKLIMEAQTNPIIETVVLDSGTRLADVIIAEINRQQNKKAISDWKDGRQFWGLFAPFCRNFFDTLAQIRKHVVFILHEKTNKTESGAIVYPVKAAWPGQVGENIGIHFTNLWRTEVQQIPAGPINTNYKWQIRTMPDAKYELKNTLGLPAVFEFNWQTIENALKKGQAK